MKRIVLVLLVAAFAPAVASAANGIANDTGYPKSDVAGKIIGSGSYTVDPGYTVVGITMTATPVGGGNPSSSSASYSAGSWSANIPGLTSKAQYNVSTQIIYVKTFVISQATTPVVVVTVQ